MEGQDQPGPSGRGAGPGQEYTRGGVKKLKFAPTVPVRRKKSEPAAPGIPVDAAESSEAFAGLLAAAAAHSEQQGRGRGRGGPTRPIPIAPGDPGPGAPGGTKPGSSSRLGSLSAGPSRAGGHLKGSAAGGGKPGRFTGKGASSSKSSTLLTIREDGTATDEEEGDQGLHLDYQQYFPTTLPFHPHPPDVQDIVDPFDELCTSGVPEDLATTQDAQDNVAARLCLEDLAAAESQLYLFQLPAALPVLRPAVKEDHKPGSKKHAAAQQQQQQQQQRPASIAELPSGQLGKLLVFASGAVKMQIGDVLFDVNVGMPCLTRQEVAALTPSANKLIHLGSVAQRAVVSPDVWHLLDPKEPQDLVRAEGCVTRTSAAVQSGHQQPGKQAQQRHHQQQQQQDGVADEDEGSDDPWANGDLATAAPTAAAPAAPAAAAPPAAPAADGAAAGSKPPPASTSKPAATLPGLHSLGSSLDSTALPGSSGLGPGRPGAAAGKPSARLDGLGLGPGGLPMGKSKLKHRPMAAPRKAAGNDDTQQ